MAISVLVAVGGVADALVEAIATRIGDVVVASLGPVALVASRRYPNEAGLIGLHGSLTDDEMLIPLLIDEGR